MAKAGVAAGTVNSRGYRHIRINNNFYQAHRLIWIYFNNQIKDGAVIDHIDGNRLNNHIENLREASVSENRVNCTTSKNIYFHSQRNKYILETRKDGRQIREAFNSLEEAINRRKSFLEEIHGKFIPNC